MEVNRLLETTMLLPVLENSQLGEARRYVTLLADALEFSEADSGKIAIVATELAGNLVKHAGGGELLVRAILEGPIPGIEIIACDKGPGIADITRSLQDGISTAGTPGNGLGAARRLMHEFDVYSKPDKGTVISCRLFVRKPAAPQDHAFGAICIPVTGEQECGDGWHVRQREAQTDILVVDGLGHGPSAAKAAQYAIETFKEHEGMAPVDTLQRIHGALVSTRGAAVAIASIDFHKGLLRYAGVGNIAGQILDNTLTRGLVSFNGTVGFQMHKVKEMTYPWPKGGQLVMYSDGLQNRWRIEDYPGLQHQHPSLMASVLYRDFQRGRDDVTVLVVSDRGRG